MSESQTGRNCGDDHAIAHLKEATRTIPIVMVALGDPLGTGLVDSLSRPSENITGMSLMVPQLAVKRLELLKELIPGISLVLVLSFLADPLRRYR